MHHTMDAIYREIDATLHENRLCGSSPLSLGMAWCGPIHVLYLIWIAIRAVGIRVTL